MDLPKKFRDIRESKKISVYKLSKLSDVSENYIHTIEKGGNQPSVAILERLLKHLGISMAEFFSEDAEILYPTQSERELIEGYRVLSSDKAEAVINITKLFSQ